MKVEHSKRLDEQDHRSVVLWAANDHIFVNAALQPVSLNIYRRPVSLVASDHFPLVAEVMVT